MASTFLKAEWRKLLMFNYAIDKSILDPYLPNKTEIDHWNGNCHVSLVGFLFSDTKLKGVRIPFHRKFEEVNLRFYVRYKDGLTWKRGVVFIKEIVPKPALTIIARTVYKENYVTMPMNHKWTLNSDSLEIEYRWKKKEWNSIKALAGNQQQTIDPGGEAAFITEHYWGYTKIDAKRTTEYQVEHPQWCTYHVNEYHVSVDFENIYGSRFKHLGVQKPVSVFLAEGSEIKVKSKTALKL